MAFDDNINNTSQLGKLYNYTRDAYAGKNNDTPFFTRKINKPKKTVAKPNQGNQRGNASAGAKGTILGDSSGTGVNTQAFNTFDKNNAYSKPIGTQTGTNDTALNTLKESLGTKPATLEESSVARVKEIASKAREPYQLPGYTKPSAEKLHSSIYGVRDNRPTGNYAEATVGTNDFVQGKPGSDYSIGASLGGDQYKGRGTLSAVSGPSADDFERKYQIVKDAADHRAGVGAYAKNRGGGSGQTVFGSPATTGNYDPQANNAAMEQSSVYNDMIRRTRGMSPGRVATMYNTMAKNQEDARSNRVGEALGYQESNRKAIRDANDAAYQQGTIGAQYNTANSRAASDAQGNYMDQLKYAQKVQNDSMTQRLGQRRLDLDMSKADHQSKQKLAELVISARNSAVNENKAVSDSQAKILGQSIEILKNPLAPSDLIEKVYLELMNAYGQIQ